MPDGTGLIFTVWSGPGWDEHQVQVLDLRNSQRHMIVKGGTAGIYVRSGHVAYSRAELLMAVPFDLSRLETTGPPVALSERAFEEDGTEFAVSDSGLLAYLSVSPQRHQRELVWVDSRGHVERIPTPPRPYVDPAVSPDGRFAAVSVQGPVQTIWVYDFARRTLTPITPATLGSSQAPVWARDGKRLAYRGTRTGFRNLFWTSVDGTEKEQRLTTSDNLQTPSGWSEDGTSLVYIEVVPETGNDILMLSIADKTPHPLLQTTASERAPAVSPDGRWLAYSSNESGAEQVYVPSVRPGWWETADLDDRRNRPGVAVEQPAVVLPQPERAHVGDDPDHTATIGRPRGRAVYWTLRADRHRRYGWLRRRGGRAPADGPTA